VFRVLAKRIIRRTLWQFFRILEESLKRTRCLFGGAPDSAWQQARCCRAVFNLELEVRMHFILNQNGELVITDEGEEVCELDETVE
jgi:hypothetical protein